MGAAPPNGAVLLLLTRDILTRNIGLIPMKSPNQPSIQGFTLIELMRVAGGLSGLGLGLSALALSPKTVEVPAEYKTVEVPAEYKTVEVPAEYKTVEVPAEYKTVEVPADVAREVAIPAMRAIEALVLTEGELLALDGSTAVISSSAWPKSLQIGDTVFVSDPSRALVWEEEEGRSAIWDDTEGRSAVWDDYEGRSAVWDDTEGRSAVWDDTEGRFVFPDGSVVSIRVFNTQD